MPPIDQPLHPKLQVTAVDRAHVALRSLTSLIDLGAPGLGSVFGELIEVTLPANRLERLAAFASDLDKAVKALGQRLEDLFQNLTPEQAALIEEGFQASARATQRARIERIGQIVAPGVADADAAVRQREVLDLLRQLSDGDLRLLGHFANRSGRDMSPQPQMSLAAWKEAPQDEKDRITEGKRLRELSGQKLVSLGLTSTTYGLVPDGFRDTMAVKEQEVRLTSLGHFFCQHIGIWPEGVDPYFG